jgi:hypothetical protein
LANANPPSDRPVAHDAELTELFSAYPRVKNEWSRLTVSPSAQASGGYAVQIGLMDVIAPTAEEARRVAAHELQHATQYREGFSRGANVGGGFLTPFSAAARKRAWDRYYKNPGEVEARNVENRLAMSPEQRRAIPPWQTVDVSLQEQIASRSLGQIFSDALSRSPLGQR